MKSYTAHLKPGHAPVLVREGFSLGAFLFGPFWLLRHRAWIPGILLLVALVVLRAAFPTGVVAIVGLGIAAIIGLVGQDLRRWSLERRGYTMAHVLAARDGETALGRLLTFRPDVAASFAGLLR